MAKPPTGPPGPHKPPQFHSLVWTTPLAMGWLHCDATPCCERGNWIGMPYLLSNRPLQQAARKWYNDRVKRMKREEVRFFHGVAIDQPILTPLQTKTALEPAQKRAAPRKAARKKPGHRPGR